MFLRSVADGNITIYFCWPNMILPCISHQRNHVWSLQDQTPDCANKSCIYSIQRPIALLDFSNQNRKSITQNHINCCWKEWKYSNAHAYPFWEKVAPSSQPLIFSLAHCSIKNAILAFLVTQSVSKIWQSKNRMNLNTWLVEQPKFWFRKLAQGCH